MRPVRLATIAVVLLASASTLAALAPAGAGQDTTRPVPVREVRPAHTDAAREARIQGTVVLEAVVLRDGTVGDLAVVTSLDRERGLDDAAVSAMKQWLFTPGTRDGKPVAVRVTVEFHFTLQELTPSGGRRAD